MDINLTPVVTRITVMAVYSNCSFMFTNIRNIITPMKLATAYTSLVKTIGGSLTNTSLRIPPPKEVIRPEIMINTKFELNRE